jgi:hypothetical protein
VSGWQTDSAKEYVDIIAIWPDGRTKRGSIRQFPPDTVEQARAKLARNVIAWVREGDADKVTGAGDGVDG